MSLADRVGPPVVVEVESPSSVRRRARRRVRVIGGLLCLALGLLAVRGAQLCVSPAEATVAASSVQRWGQVTVRAPRGDILDRDGRRLATTVDAPSVVVDPTLVDPEAVPGLSRQVAEILELDPGTVAERMRRRTRYARLARHVHPAAVDRIRALGHPALWTHPDPRRYYPEASLGAQVLGFVDGAGIGRQGLEAALDDHLQGGSFVVQRRRDRRGRGIEGPVQDPWSAAGLDVHTTLDRRIQRIAERALEGVMDRSAPEAAYATVVDVRTGDLLAVAHAPAYDPNAVGADPGPRRNRAVQDAIEPGSVLKIFSVAAALEAGLVEEDTPIDCENGAWFVGRTRIRDVHPRQEITATEVLKYSSNIGIAKLALEMGPEAFLPALQRFGFGARSGIVLPGERRGQLRDPAAIRPIELATTSYGQGMTSTQIQVAMGVAAIANGGLLMRPRLVTKVVDVDGVPAWQQRPDAVRRVIQPETAAAVTRMMVAVTEPGGTATRAAIPGYRVAGKTGTAEKVEDGRYGAGRIASFVGFVPADDPVLAVVVTVDDPSRGSRFGGVVAAPVFAEIAEPALRHLGVPPDPLLLADRSPAPVLDPVLAPEPVRLGWTGEAWTVPDLTGRPMREVLAGLQQAGIGVLVEGSGRAVAQRPEPGDTVTLGDTVSVVFR